MVPKGSFAAVTFRSPARFEIIVFSGCLPWHWGKIRKNFGVLLAISSPSVWLRLPPVALSPLKEARGDGFQMVLSFFENHKSLFKSQRFICQTSSALVHMFPLLEVPFDSTTLVPELIIFGQQTSSDFSDQCAQEVNSFWSFLQMVDPFWDLWERKPAGTNPFSGGAIFRFDKTMPKLE